MLPTAGKRAAGGEKEYRAQSGGELTKGQAAVAAADPLPFSPSRLTDRRQLVPAALSPRPAAGHPPSSAQGRREGDSPLRGSTTAPVDVAVASAHAPPATTNATACVHEWHHTPSSNAFPPTPVETYRPVVRQRAPACAFLSGCSSRLSVQPAPCLLPTTRGDSHSKPSCRPPAPLHNKRLLPLRSPHPLPLRQTHRHAHRHGRWELTGTPRPPPSHLPLPVNRCSSVNAKSAAQASRGEKTQHDRVIAAARRQGEMAAQ